MNLEIQARPFNFPGLVKSHGWVNLAPFCWNEQKKCLGRPVTVKHGKIVPIELRVTASRKYSTVIINSEKPLDKVERKTLRLRVRRMLCLDIDFTDFHAICANDPNLKFVCSERRGGFLRGETLFEDMVKTVFTTNCDWRNTKKMCDAFCDLDGGAFPSPKRVLRYSEKELSMRVPLGYRARTVLEIADLISRKQLPLDKWAVLGEYRKIKSALHEIWGFGPYSVAHMLVLLGCFEEIPIDSENLKFIRDLHFEGRKISMADAIRPYMHYGKYKFLAYKYDRIGRKLNYIDK